MLYRRCKQSMGSIRRHYLEIRTQGNRMRIANATSEQEYKNVVFQLLHARVDGQENVWFGLNPTTLNPGISGPFFVNHQKSV